MNNINKYILLIIIGIIIFYIFNNKNRFTIGAPYFPDPIDTSKIKHNHKDINVITLPMVNQGLGLTLKTNNLERTREIITTYPSECYRGADEGGGGSQCVFPSKDCIYCDNYLVYPINIETMRPHKEFHRTYELSFTLEYLRIISPMIYVIFGLIDIDYSYIPKTIDFNMSTNVLNSYILSNVITDYEECAEYRMEPFFHIYIYYNHNEEIHNQHFVKFGIIISVRYFIFLDHDVQGFVCKDKFVSIDMDSGANIWIYLLHFKNFHITIDQLENLNNTYFNAFYEGYFNGTIDMDEFFGLNLTPTTYLVIKGYPGLQRLIDEKESSGRRDIIEYLSHNILNNLSQQLLLNYSILQGLDYIDDAVLIEWYKMLFYIIKWIARNFKYNEDEINKTILEFISIAGDSSHIFGSVMVSGTASTYGPSMIDSIKDGLKAAFKSPTYDGPGVDPNSMPS